MGTGSNGESKGIIAFKVNPKSKERIAAVLPLQEHWLPLSNLDLLLPPLDFGVFFCYEKNKQQLQFEAKVSHLKVSLAQTLVIYYPFAGEVVTNTAGEPELLCNNRGVDFVVAYADVELGELQVHNPDETVEKKLVPEKKGGVLCVQVTELKCGGMVLACTFDHRIADAYSANMFLVAWSEMATRLDQDDHMIKKPIALPSFRRSLLSPRRPCSSNNSTLNRLYVPLSLVPPPLPPSSPVINRIYCVSAAEIEQMQVSKRTKLESFSAYLWRVIGKAAMKRRQVNVCRMGIVVDGRKSLNNNDQVMDNYFGNVLSIPYGIMDVDDLENREVSEVAETVHEFVKEAVSEDHFLGLIDWVETMRPEPAAARIYLKGDGENGDGVAFVVSSGRGFPVREVELGWGKPVFGSYHFPWGGSAGYVMPMPSASRNGDWVVYMHLAKDLVEVLEEEAGHVFRPLTPDYMLHS